MIWHCAQCNETYPVEGKGVCPFCNAPLVRKRGGHKRPDRTATAKLSERQLRALHRLHIEHNMSIRELGRRVWQRAGYTSPKVAANGISAGFKRLGLQARSQVDATVLASTTHGKGARNNKAAYRRWKRRQKGLRPMCKGVRLSQPRKGEPCGLRATEGSEYCHMHDPEREEERKGWLGAARAKFAR